MPFIDPLFRFLYMQVALLINALRGLIPPVPPAIAEACAQVAAAVGWLGPVMAFAPWQALVIGLGLMISGALIGLGVLIARIGLSVFLLGGGGT